MKITSALLSIYLLIGSLQLALAFEEHQNIPLKAVVMPVPDINNEYDVVHSVLYVGDKFKNELPKDFYVTKAMKNKDKIVEDINKAQPKTDVPTGPPYVPASAAQNTNKNDNSNSNSNSNNINPPFIPQNINKNNIPQPASLQNIQNNPNPDQLANNPPPAKQVEQIVEQPQRHGKAPLDQNQFAANDKQQIRWQVRPPKSPHPFVLENGVQQTLTPALPKTKEFVYAEEGKGPTEIPPPAVQNNLQTNNNNNNNLHSEITKQSPQLFPQTQTQPKTPPTSQPTKPIPINPQLQKRYDQNENTMYFLAAGFLVLIAVFFIVRANKINSRGSIKLPTKLQTYKEEEQDQDAVNFKQRTAEDFQYNPTTPELEQRDGSDSSDDERLARNQTSLID